MATPFSAPILSSTSPALSSNRVNPTWWTPLFGWSSEPDYIGNTGSNISSSAIKTGPSKEVLAQNADPETGRCRSNFRPGCFTEDKAKELRRMTTQSSNFHDVMYHSAIASRLASDFSGR